MTAATPAAPSPGRLGYGLFLAVAAIPTATLAFSTWVVRAQGLVTMGGHLLVVRDYLWVWAAGNLLRAGDVATIFHPIVFADRLRGLFGAGLDNHVWSYPPSMLLLAMPAGYLPLVGGDAVYALAQILLLWLIGRAAGLPLAVRLAVLASPALLENALGGQNGAMTAALLVGGLMLADRRPVLAGVLFGLLTVKPQLGLIVPVCLLASRNWKAIATAAAVAAALLLLSVASFGFESWRLFVTNTMPYASIVLQQPWNGSYYQTTMVTPFMALRLFDVGLLPARVLQGLASMAAVAVAWRLWRRPAADPAARMAVTSALGLLATPYAFNYDMIAVTTGIACLAADRRARVGPPWEALALASGWLWPGVAFVAVGAGGLPLGPLVLAAVAWVGWRRLDAAPVVA